jgi:hypothetical protein
MAKRSSIGIPTLRTHTPVTDEEAAKALEELRYQVEVVLRQLVEEVDILKGLRGTSDKGEG